MASENGKKRSYIKNFTKTEGDKLLKRSIFMFYGI